LHPKNNKEKMKTKLVLLIGLSIGFLSCKGNSDNGDSVKKEFTSDKDNCYMIHSSYPSESVKWDKMMATINIVKAENTISYSSFILNFKTENFINEHEVDSAFVELTPYPNENYGNSKVIINMVDGKFKNDFNWNNKPVIDTNHYAVVEKIDEKSSRRIRVNVTNLVKYSSQRFQYDLPLSFSLYGDNLQESSFASFYSPIAEIKKTQPKLEIYYKK
jgi:hypothetical protein